MIQHLITFGILVGVILLALVADSWIGVSGFLHSMNLA